MELAPAGSAKDEAAEMLEIYLLGQFRVLLDGRPVRIPERPAQSLLAYLALTVGREHRREKLAGMLWPDAPEANARKYLRHALWRIRNSLQEAGSDPDEFLRVSEISLAVKEDPPPWLDAHQLLRSSPENDLSEGELMEAVSLYRGELLPGFFEDWTALEREQVRAHVQRLMQVLLDRLLRQQRWREAEEWGERWIAMGDVPEPAYRAVMVARAGSGDRSGAVATYQRAVADLERELGLEPSPSLRSVFDDLTRPIPRLLKQRDRLRDSAGRLRGELRPVTILQVDLVGMTALAAPDDLESLKELLDESVGSLVDEVLSYEGTIVRVESDGLLACFGAPVAHEDDTGRALMTALRMRDRFGPASSDRLSLRIGVEAGELLVGEHGWDVRLGYSAVGRAVNLAGLLKGGAQAREILVGEAGYNEAKLVFEFGPGRNVEAKGRDRVVAYPLLSERIPDPGQITEHRTSPLVGREDELATLLRMVDTGEHGVAFVVGEPGIGKSRLIDEVRRRRREIRWGQGNCVSFGANLPYHPLAEAIGRLIDQDIGRDAGSTEEHLLHVFAGVSASQRDRHATAISRLLGLDAGWSTPPDRPDVDPVSLVDAVVTLLRELGRDRRVVLTIEDLHWADDATITLIHQILKQSPTPPLMLILSMRPIGETSAWMMREDLLTSNGFGIEEIHLEGLGEQAMSELLDSIGPPPRRVRDVLIRRSDGNPFFLEEMYRTLMDTGVVTHRAGEWRLEGDLGPFDVPTTVQKTILARADQLPDTERWVLQAASVTGWQFPESILETVSGVEVRQPLETLAKADFVRLRSLTPEPIYVFRHSLIREAIERTLLKSDRRRLHLRAGEALEEVLEKRPDIQPALLVYHYVLAGAPERALRFAPAMAELAWRAVAPLESAHALELALKQDPPPDLAVRLLVSVARARFAAADMAASIEAYDEAIRIARGIDDLSMMAEYMADAAMYRWQITESRESGWEYLESAIRSVASIPDSRGKLLLLQEVARQYLSAGDVGRAKDLLVAARTGLEALSAEERASLESHVLNTEGLLALREGQFESGSQLLHQALDLAEESAALVATSRSRTNLATAMIDVYGKLEEGLALIEETRETVALRGIWAAFVEETVHLARVRWGEGNIDKGLSEIELLATAMRGQSTWLSLSGAKAPLLSAMGDDQQAMSAAQDGWDAAQRTGDALLTGHAGLSMGRVLGYAGRPQEAEPFLEAAATAAIAAPALRSEILAEWIYASHLSESPARVDDFLEDLDGTPTLSPYVAAWKGIGSAMASRNRRGLLESADYFEQIGQSYVAWLHRFRAGRLVASPDLPVSALAQSWAAEKGLVLF